MSSEPLAACAERIDVLLSKIEALPDLELQDDLREVVQCLLDYHKEALARLLSLAQRENGGSQPFALRLIQDELVSSLLLLHGLHPLDLESRVLEALVRVRPFLESHGGGVELIKLDGGVVRLRLQGNCHGCPSSIATLRSRIERAIYELAPDVQAVEVDETTDPPMTAQGFVGVERLQVG